MSALSREELVIACAKLYDMSQENYMLPPLTRGAAEAAETSFTYHCLAKEICLKFTVVFDDEHVQRHKFPLLKLPVQFRAQVCDRELKDLPIKLADREKSALIYAFLLGVKAPIVLEEEDAQSGYTLSIQLSPTFSARWRQAIDLEADATADDICRQVGLSLYEKSRDCFTSQADGVAIWSVRAAQELLGAPKPSAEALWSCVAPLSLLAPPRKDANLTKPPARSGHEQRSVARILEKAPLPALVAAKPWRPGQSPRGFYALIAALLLAGTLGSLRGAGLRAAIDAPGPRFTTEAAPMAGAPQSAAALAPPDDATQNAWGEPEPVMAPLTDARIEEPAALSVPPPRAANDADIVTPSSPPAGLAAIEEPASTPPPRPPQANSKPPKQASALKSANTPASPKAARVPGQEKTAYRKTDQPDNPLVLMGNAIHHLATHVAKGLQSIPRRLSTL
jgi:hypothetical protein